MEQIPVYIVRVIFLTLIVAAFYCGIRGILIWIKVRMKEALLAASLPLASGMAAISSMFLSDFFIPPSQLFFFTYDFYLYLFFLLSPAFKRRWEHVSKILIAISIIASFTPLLFQKYSHIIHDTITTVYAYILCILSIKVLIKFLKTSTPDSKHNAFHFWLYSSCFFYNSFTLVFSFKYFLDKELYYMTILLVINTINLICFIIKYFLILNAVTCLQKN
jgi:hypothetical protein